MKRAYYTQIVLSGAVGTFKFADDSTLNGKDIIGIDVFSVGQLSKAPDGSTILTDADSKLISLSLYNNNEEIYSKIPKAVFDPTLNNGVHFDFQGQVFQWNQCKVNVHAALSGAVTLPVIVYYNN